MSTDQKFNKDTVEYRASNLFTKLKDVYITVSKKEVQSWKGFMILGFLSGFTAALFLFASQGLPESIFATSAGSTTNQALVTYQDTDFTSYGPTSSNSVVTTISVNNPPTVSISANPTSGNVPLTVNFTATAQDSDGTIASYVWDFGDSTISNTQNPTHTYNTAGAYTAKIDVTDNGGATASASVGITATPPPNNAPVAQAQSVSTAEDTAKSITVVATDVDGDPLTYSVVASPTHGVLSGTAPNLTYTPATNYNGADSFTFRSNDGKVDSNIATVSITVTPVNNAPVANAGTNQIVVSGSVVTLNGSGSSDPDRDSLTYQWVQTAGTAVTLSSATTVTPTFTAPMVSTVTTLTFQLTVNDGSLSSNALVTITVNPDTILPTVILTAPLNGATVVAKSVVSLVVSATDNVGVTQVQFFINGNLLSSDLTAPYSASWKVPAVRGKTYQIQATATDAAGNVGRSTIIKVTTK